MTVLTFASRYAFDCTTVPYAAEGDIVDEHSPVHPSQVDSAFDVVDEGIQTADQVAAVDAHVEREVVARPRGDAHERQVVRGRNGCHRGLGPVPSRHADRVSPVGDLGERQGRQVVSRLEHHRADPSGGTRRRDPARTPSRRLTWG
jgi:hypothetical protein